MLIYVRFRGQSAHDEKLRKKKYNRTNALGEMEKL